MYQCSVWESHQIVQYPVKALCWAEKCYVQIGALKSLACGDEQLISSWCRPDTQRSHAREASLKGYFEKDYKQGGVFEHDDYEHVAQDWCWLHKGSGIKVRCL